MWGQGLRPASYHPMVDAASEADLQRYVDTNAREVQTQVAALGRHEDFIARLAKTGKPAS